MTENLLKLGLSQGRRMAGFWLTLDSPTITELAAQSGADWLLVDMEHSPTRLSGIGDHLRAAMAGEVETIVRVPQAEPVIVKRLLDLGARSLMFPMIESAEDARRVVSWTRYPPEGSRGISATMRGNRYGRDATYLKRYAEDLCVIVQVETPEAVAAIPQIAAVEGIDAIFVGPGDLAASMGHLGKPATPEVQRKIDEARAAITNAGKPAGILGYGEPLARDYFDRGFGFVAVAGDSWLLARQLDALIASLKG